MQQRLLRDRAIFKVQLSETIYNTRKSVREIIRSLWDKKIIGSTLEVLFLCNRTKVKFKSVKKIKTIHCIPILLM